MKLGNKHLRFLIAAAIAVAAVAAQAVGVDVQAFTVTHSDVLTGVSMLAVGNLEAVLASLDKVEAGFGSFKASQIELADRMLKLEQKGSMRGGDGFEAPLVQGIGAMVVKELEGNRELLDKTRSVRLVIKAAGDPVTTASGRNILTGGVGVPTGRVLGLQYGVPQRPAASASAIEYSRFTGTQGAAAQQAAEGDAKAAVRPDHGLIVQSALTVAGYAKLSRQALNDRVALARAVETTLRRSVDTALDAALYGGATGFVGGIEGLATAYTSLVYQTMADAVSEGVATMQLAGFNPDVVALSPSDWLAVVVKKGTANDHYLSGNYLGAMPQEMRGLRVVLSPSVDAGKALLMDSSHVELLVVDDFSVELAYDGNDFTKNLVTMLGELRAIPIFLTTGAARLITPKA